VRARKLVATFAAELGGDLTTAMRIAVERAATLVVLAEDARARRLAGDTTISLDDLVRTDRVAAQAVRQLGLQNKALREREGSPLDVLLRGNDDGDERSRIF
jgi:hypothetical protein